MPTLNRFPLLGLWAREAAHRIGYEAPDADALGHAYAVLYAIRSNSTGRPGRSEEKTSEGEAQGEGQPAPTHERISFGGDEIQVERRDGRILGRVGDDGVQTTASYRYKIVSKFPTGYHDRLRDAFRKYFETIDPVRLDSKMIYTVYDQWKKQCGTGRLVDLDRLLLWCEQRRQAVTG
jgi:hypothetical protein